MITNELTRFYESQCIRQMYQLAGHSWQSISRRLLWQTSLKALTLWQSHYYLILKIYEPQSHFARLWLDSQHDNLPKGIRTIKMC